MTAAGTCSSAEHQFRSEWLRRPELVKMVGALGREFIRRGMHAHAAKLRIYYLALRRRLATPGRSEVDVHWSEVLVVECYEQFGPMRTGDSRERTGRAPLAA